ncbi:alpha/beta fold hydrolase [Fibrella sp. HMF5335]|uniref:Alpha/beta fold hydrolase n=1 Tax=Fibrella rubiginis TaxID=2817060 RepID=A0A939K7F1_9BACT|nr:alpha/beta fold hydrolase [Fibrella rubiginis]MBO0939878.1 alpha/beta fold hydrolase [Fibrella rubiginis]
MLNTFTRNPPQRGSDRVGASPALTLVFLHYYGGSAQSWTAVVDALAPDYGCLVFDLPGFGESPPLSDHQGVDDVALVVANAIAEQIGDTPFVLVGHSMGGKIALAIAAGRPGQAQPAGLRAMVLLATSPPGPEPIPDDSRQEMLDKPSLSPLKQRESAEKTLAKITRKPLSEAVRAQTIADNLRASPEAWIAWPAIGSRDNITNRMARITVPVALLVGDQDEALASFVQPDMVQPYLPQATLRILPGVGHLLPMEVPDEVVNQIREVCSKLA